MIKPTVGRVVWVIRTEDTTDIQQPEVGLVTYVWHERMINVAGFDHNGKPFVLNSLTLIQDDDAKPEVNFACWMPYQKIQTEKHQALADLSRSAS